MGSPIIAPTITSKVPRGKFEITYTAELFGILEKLGNKKIQVLSYLLDNKDGNNSLNMTNTQIATATGISRKTVIETVKLLAEAGLAKRQGSVIMISSNLMVKGNQVREAYLMRKYVEMDQDIIDVQASAKDVVLDGQLQIIGQNEDGTPMIGERAKA